MKVTRAEKAFEPITIVLETKEEAYILYKQLEHNLDYIEKDNRVLSFNMFERYHKVYRP